MSLEQNSSITPMPIIIGAARSGTTLLRLMLDAHSRLAIPPETGFLAAAPSMQGNGAILRKKFFDTIINYPPNMPTWPDFRIADEVFWKALVQVEPFTIAEGYRTFYRLYARRFGKPRYGDKTPVYCHEVRTIRSLLPEARFIHLIRDGRDVAVSLRKRSFSPGWDIKVQAKYWMDFVLHARQAGLGHSDYLEVQYETLIREPRQTLQKICEFIELDFEDSMLDYHLRSRDRLTEHAGRFKPDGSVLISQEERIKAQLLTMQPPDVQRIFAWKSVLAREEIQLYQQVAGDLLAELGYEICTY